MMKMTSKTKGKSREQIDAEGLENRNAVLGYVRRHPRCDIDAICAVTGCARASVRTWLLWMVETGHVTLYQTDVGEGRYRNLWTATDTTAPLEKFDRSAVDFTRKDPVIKRTITKAKQIGMKRDWLVAALFGEAVRA